MTAALLAIVILGPPPSVADRIVAGARRQLEWRTQYTTGYFKLAYPGGDLPRDQGVCTDVVVRALRFAGYDLQKLIHEDMKRAWGSYRRYPGSPRPDRNIDHRRVPNQVVFFARNGVKLSTDLRRGDWRPGDFVYWKLDNGLDHIGVLTDRFGPSGLPMVIHNISVVSEEDCLAAWRVVGHYRYPVR